MNYAKQFDTRTAKRSNRQSVFTKTEEKQVPNSEGAFVWQVGDWDRLNRFLILGAEGGTYYVAERDLVKTNHEAILRCIQTDGVRTVKEAFDVSVQGRAYKNDPAVFVLALCSAHGDAATRAAAHAAVAHVCRTGTHLQHFMQFASALRGMGRGLRNAIGRWYTEMEAHRLAYQAIKYQSRDGWSHRDLLRLAHPTAATPEQDAVLRWMIGGKSALGARTVKGDKAGRKKVREFGDVSASLPVIIDAFEQAKTASTAKLVALITEHNLPREAVPTNKLNEPDVWEALLDRMPLNAMIRTLGKMTSVGLLKPLTAASNMVTKRLRDEKYLLKSRVHPMQVLLAAKTYGQGHGMKGSLTWTPVPAVMSALDTAFYLTFPNVKSSGRPMLICLDVSSSMERSLGGTPLSSCEAVAALALVHCNVEPEVHVQGFCHQLVDLGIRKGQSLEEATSRAQKHNFGSTNVSLAYEYALMNKLEVGAFLVMTDSETNQGHQPYQRLREYRQRFVSDARSIVVATTSTGFTVSDPADKWSLDVAGFDASVPALISDFIRGDTDKPKEASGQEEEPATED